MITIKTKHLTILAAFVSVLTIFFCFWMVQIHKSAVKAEEALEIAAEQEAIANASAEDNTINNVSTTENTAVSEAPNTSAQNEPIAKATDLVKLTDFMTVKIDDFYKSNLFLLNEGGHVVEKTMPEADVMIKRGTLEKLKKADALLKEQGYNMVIYCAYRDEQMQVLLRQHYENLTGDVDKGYNYVARPGKSKHQFGQAVDMTIESFVGERQDPTPYLEFSENVKPEKHTDNEFLKILQKTMVESGFEIYKGEWWHFNDNTVYE